MKFEVRRHTRLITIRVIYLSRTVARPYRSPAPASVPFPLLHRSVSLSPLPHLRHGQLVAASNLILVVGRDGCQAIFKSVRVSASVAAEAVDDRGTLPVAISAASPVLEVRDNMGNGISREM